MSFLELLKSIPTDVPYDELPPETHWAIHKSAVGLLRGQEGGHSDIPDRDTSKDVNYGEYDGLASLSEPKRIEAEIANWIGLTMN